MKFKILTKLKLLVAIIISILPFNIIRVFTYRILLRYKIKESQIGFGTIIAVSTVTAERVTIGRFNLFIGPMSLSLRTDSYIGSFNTFRCGLWTLGNPNEYRRYLYIDEKALITDRHYVDVAGSFILGKNSWIAGYESQFWTHGMGVLDKNITIGANCYIGSAVRFAPGSEIGDNVVVALGSVIAGKLKTFDALVGGVPAKVIKNNYGWQKTNFLKPVLCSTE